MSAWKIAVNAIWNGCIEFNSQTQRKRKIDDAFYSLLFFKKKKRFKWNLDILWMKLTEAKTSGFDWQIPNPEKNKNECVVHPLRAK